MTEGAQKDTSVPPATARAAEVGQDAHEEEGEDPGYQHPPLGVLRFHTTHFTCSQKEGEARHVQERREESSSYLPDPSDIDSINQSME